jgi:hypothetical protein
VAAIVFWTTFGAYQHGVPDKIRHALLQYVASECGNDWHTDALYRRVWDQEHDAIVDHLHAQVQTYCEQWLDSPAGVAFKDLVDNMKAAKKGKLDLLTAEDLALFQHGTDKPRKGIEWTAVQILEIFHFLVRVTDVQKVPKVIPWHLAHN